MIDNQSLALAFLSGGWGLKIFNAQKGTAKLLAVPPTIFAVAALAGVKQ